MGYNIPADHHGPLPEKMTATQALAADQQNSFDLYAQWTDVVAKYPPTAEPFYLALGIVDEFGELMDARSHADQVKEAGDTCWYVARYCVRVLKVPFSTLIERAKELRRSGILSPAANLGIICGIEKKRIRDGVSWDAQKVSEKHEASYNALANVLSIVLDILDDNATTLEECLVINREKLSARLDAGTIQGDGDNR